MKGFVKKGFTLIELVAVIGIIGMIFSIMLVLFQSGISMYSNGMRIEATETNSRLALEALTKNIKVSKELFSTEKITTDSNFSGLFYDISKTKPIIQSDLRAYLEDYNGNKYIYLIENNSGKKELHELKLTTDQAYNMYNITKDPTDSSKYLGLSLTETDKQKIDNGSQEVLTSDTTKYIIDYGLFPYAISNPVPTLMYDNFGADCYLIATVTPTGDRMKYKLQPKFNNGFKVVTDTKISENVEEISIKDFVSEVEISISVKNGSTPTRTVKTRINILNQNNY